MEGNGTILIDEEVKLAGFLGNIKGEVELAILLFIVIAVVSYLYYRFAFSRRCVKLPDNKNDSSHIPGPKEWEQQMEELSLEHQNVKRKRYNFVLSDRNKLAHKELNHIRNTISVISSDLISLIPAARWLFDNFQIMYREIKKESMWDTSYEKLPILRNKMYKGYPRVYLVAKNMVAMSRGHVNEENIAIMLHTYQKETPLTDEELGVLPSILGFCLVEQIIEVADEIISIIKIKAKADRFVKEKISVHHSETDISALLCDIDADCKENFSFHSQVIYILRNMSFSKAAILKYTEFHYAMDNKYRQPANIFSEEGKLESYLESNIQVLIGSLREISEIDEQQFFEELSCVESILVQDPAGVYPKMEPVSRAMYRSIIIKVSKQYKIKEESIARDCLTLAKEGKMEGRNANHVGTYLLGKGYPLLRSKIRNRRDPNERQQKIYFDLANRGKAVAYYVVVFLIWVVLGVGIALFMSKVGRIDQIYLYVLLLIVASPILLGLALAITNYIFMKEIPIRKIPALDYQRGIPGQARTFLIMPVLVSSKDQCLDYLERLERHYLANRQSNLYFALLVDFEDATEQRMTKDKELENILYKKIEEYNQHYAPQSPRFCLFIRKRKWNEAENCYMGWERKRGKIEEFNQLLCGVKQEETTYTTIVCDKTILETFKYVITLDADSDMIPDNGAKLVGIIDHPLNQPVIDEQTGKLVDGYAIIQPTVKNHIIDEKSSRFSNIFGDESGLSHYSYVVSDVYQDVFNQGVYVGKGIYDVQAFRHLLQGMIPENRVLSHDLLESCYVRTAFSSAVKILDGFPSTLLSYVKREQRWIRGDWQLLPWLFKKHNVNGLSKWKIFDNLRRSVVPIAKLVFLLLNVVLMPKLFYLGFILVFFSDMLRLLQLFGIIVVGKIKKPRLTILHREVWREVLKRIQRAVLEVVFIPYRSYMALAAIGQTIYRLVVSKKNLLQWNTSDSVEKTVENSKTGYFHKLWVSIIPGIFVLVCLYFVDLPLVGDAVYSILAIAWIVSYFLAYYIGHSKAKGTDKLKLKNQKLLLETVHRTWLFFKVFSKKENGWLCPDNYQEDPQKKVSIKTSPTNIGLQFLTILSARDLGFEAVSELVERVSNLLTTVEKLPKWKGHLYNWYNINTGEVLDPAYISTVDSGNFFGHMIALKNGLEEQIDLPIISESEIKEGKGMLAQIGQIDLLRAQYNNFGEFEIDLKIIKEKLLVTKEERVNRASENNERSEDVVNKGEENRERETIEEQIQWIDKIVTEIQQFGLEDSELTHCKTLREVTLVGNFVAAQLIETIEEDVNRINQLLENVSFSCLFNRKRKLFYIGYHVSSETMDNGCYDLMASEALLTSYLAIARGDVPGKHWNKLGRLLTMVKGIPCLVSWSGTMFEYLMPKLVMKEYGGTVFANTSKAAVMQQIHYAKQKKIPWGISESQYYRFDLDSNYQYKAFGVPQIRLKPSFSESLVVTPYATMLALPYAEKSALENLQELVAKDAFGRYGFYEAIDFATNNPGRMKEYAVIKSYMAHHQGMIMVAINNYLNQGIMQTRFHKEPIIKANETLLEEKLESHFILIARKGYTVKTRKEEYKEEILSNRYVNTTAPLLPIANYLCNDRYSTMITSDGDGFSKYINRMIYRWRPDPYAMTGNYIYIKDVGENKIWSATYHPTKVEPDTYQAIMSPNQTEFERKDGDICTHTAVSIGLSHDIEIRKVGISNCGKEDKIIQLTSYLEVVEDEYRAELSHPAFNKLFIESEFLKEESIFLARRRNQHSIDQPYLMHMVRSGEKYTTKIEYENDRLKFIGRNRTLENPDAMGREHLLNNAGFSKDPIMSIRVNILVKAGENASVSYITGVCKDPDHAIQVGEEFNDTYRIDDAIDQFRRQSEMELKYLEISRPQLNAYQDLVSPIFYPTRYFRGPAERIRKNWKNQSFLWKFGVSGDIPIMLLKVKSIEEEGIIKDVLKAYEYYRINLMKVDLIILNQSKHGYMDELNDFLNEMISTLKIYDESSEKKSLFIINEYQLIPAEMDLLDTVAMVVFSNDTGIYFRKVKEMLGEIVEE